TVFESHAAFRSGSKMLIVAILQGVEMGAKAGESCRKHASSDATYAHCSQLEVFNITGIWITDIPDLQTDHLRYPDLLEQMGVPDGSSGALSIKPGYCSHHRCQGSLDSPRTLETHIPTAYRWRFPKPFEVAAHPMWQRNLIDLHPDVADTRDANCLTGSPVHLSPDIIG
ncbi:MAG: hypothetical protein WCA45_07345, partial [Thiobacillaceae bacterium]